MLVRSRRRGQPLRVRICADARRRAERGAAAARFAVWSRPEVTDGTHAEEHGCEEQRIRIGARGPRGRDQRAAVGAAELRRGAAGRGAGEVECGEDREDDPGSGAQGGEGPRRAGRRHEGEGEPRGGGGDQGAAGGGGGDGGDPGAWREWAGGWTLAGAGDAVGAEAEADGGLRRGAAGRGAGEVECGEDREDDPGAGAQGGEGPRRAGRRHEGGREPRGGGGDQGADGGGWGDGGDSGARCDGAGADARADARADADGGLRRGAARRGSGEIECGEDREDDPGSGAQGGEGPRRAGRRHEGEREPGGGGGDQGAAGGGGGDGGDPR